MKEKLKKLLQAISNPRLLLCFGLGWIITNGWSYVLLGIGTWLDISWMKAVAGAYLTFLWLPISPEKLVTVAIAIALLRFLFPEDKKTLALLKNMVQKLKMKNEERKERKKNKDNNSSDNTDEDAGTDQDSNGAGNTDSKSSDIQDTDPTGDQDTDSDHHQDPNPADREDSTSEPEEQ